MEKPKDQLILPLPGDWHVHLRRQQMLRSVLQHSVSWCGQIMVMPNTDPPILNGIDVQFYLIEIESHLGSHGRDLCTPLVSFQVTPETTVADVHACANAGAVAGKVYPKRMTTNSHNGVEDYPDRYPVFAAMEERGLVLCLHGESPAPDLFCLDRPRRFLEDIFPDIVARFPRLRIVLEHVNTAQGVQAVLDAPNNVVGGITPHHMLLTLDDVVGYMLHPHNYCKPLAQRPEDRDAVRAAAMRGDGRFILGTDTAPHLREKKECASGCAGIFVAPVALPLYVQMFEESGKLDQLPSFLTAGGWFYGRPPDHRTIRLVRETWTVPPEINGIVPFMAGKQLTWRVMPRESY